MDFGLLFAFENPRPWQVSSAQLCRSMVRQGVLAEELGTAQGLHFFGAPPIIGTPEDAIQEITRSQQEAGVTHLVMWMQIGGIDPRRAEHSMRLFAKEVMPHFAVQEG